MPNNKTFNTEIHFGGKVSPSIKKSTQTVCGYLKTMTNTMLGMAGIASVSMVFSTIKDKALETVEAAKAEIEANTKLQAVLQNVVSLQKQGPNAYKAAAEALHNQAGEIQKIGVIGDEVTVAGMQQLATFQLSNKEISMLAGGMTDLLAQQKGLNAEQGDAVNIANMIGKAMMGNVGALSRVGITFSKAQAKAIKTGNSIQRAAVLAKVLQQNVGGVNAALAATDQGVIKQVNNEWSDMEERIGMKILPLQAQLAKVTLAYLPIVENVSYGVIAAITSISGSITNIVDFIQTNGIPIMTALGTATAAIATAATIDLIKYLGTSVLIASQEGLIATTNWGRYLMVVKGIPAAMKTWAASTWATVWANRALRYAIIGTGVGTAILLVTELALHWKEVWQAIKTATSWLGKFFNKGGANAGTPDAVKNVNKKAKVSERNALGTPSFTGGATIVGEHGPELAVLPPATSIFSNNKTKDILNTPNAIGGMSFYITIQGNADKSVVKNAVQSTVPSIKQQIDAYFKERQRKGLSFA